jgi:replicative DNA helicase Mcm
VAIINLSEDAKLLDKLVQSLAPTVYGMVEVKIGILLTLFSGTTRILPDGRLVRGIIHILLIGDPGTAKSVLLQYVLRLAPRSTFTSGKGTSTAGLTAAVMKDTREGKDDQQWSIEAGALPLSDRGVAIVDEMGQLREEDKSALHEAMESLIIHVRKAGLNAELFTRCSVVGGGNPKMGRFDPYDHLAEQINMPPTLMSRFDLIFTILDRVDAEKDKNISDQILRTRYAAELLESRCADQAALDEAMECIRPEIEPELLRKYISYARQLPSPVMTLEAREKAQELYLEMRKPDAYIVTARSQEGIVRLSEASARMRLSSTVDLEDVERAAAVIRASLEQTALDPDTKKIDTDILTIGIGQSQRERSKVLMAVLMELKHEYKGGVPLDDFKDKLGAQGYKLERLDGDLKKLKEIGKIYYPKEGFILPG